MPPLPPDTLRVRAYNVRFGDAILVTVPDKDPGTGTTTIRHVLIDVGNVLSGEGGEDAVFKPVIDDVLRELGGRPLDLYVMTHEHMDHVQGLYFAASKIYPDLKDRLKAAYAWLTASAAENYYDTHDKAKRKRARHLAMFDAVARFFAAGPQTAQEPYRSFLLNNDPRSTAECVSFLRKLAAKTTYVYRGVDLANTHPFKEATFKIWAPEEDTSDYYGRFQPMSVAVAAGSGLNGADAQVTPTPPAGVDAGAFYNLLEARRRGIADNLFAIDQAANNSSVVFSLAWRGWRLLFAGDAEIRSWKTMEREGVLEPVHFLKVSHHGSHNGTPDAQILEAVLPARRPDRRKRYAVISTYERTYSGIPHTPTNTKLMARCDLHSTIDDVNAPYVDTLIAAR